MNVEMYNKIKSMIEIELCTITWHINGQLQFEFKKYSGLIAVQVKQKVYRGWKIT